MLVWETVLHMIKCALIIKGTHSLKVIFYMSHSFDTDMKNTNSSFKNYFLKNLTWECIWQQKVVVFYTISVFLQPIKSMTFERIRRFSFLFQSSEKPSPWMIPRLFFIHIKHISDWNKYWKPNTSLAELPLSKPFFRGRSASSLQFLCHISFTHLESVGWWQHE